MSTGTSIGDIEEEVLRMLQGFVSDPPDSDYQRGYLAALIELSDKLLNIDDSAVTTMARDLLKSSG